MVDELSGQLNLKIVQINEKQDKLDKEILLINADLTQMTQDLDGKLSKLDG